MSNEEYRIEKDLLGEVAIPMEAYYGVNTARAIENFPISGLRFPRIFIRALGLIKYSAAKANLRLGLLDHKRAEAIMKAAIEVAEGRWDDQILVDIFQTGSGTSTNMNINEVIANRAAELLGGKKGDKKLVHPNDHVNMCQSTNDVFPTAIHVSVAESITKTLIPNLKTLEDALWSKSREFEGVVKSGRTHLQDAVPITLGQEFSGYASAIRHGIQRLQENFKEILELPIGGTAVGTGLNAHPEFGRIVIEELSNLTGISFKLAENRFEQLQLRDACVSISGCLKTIAGSILKIVRDLRLLSSGPNTGLGELEVPAVQSGSSIMPGKVNPVILESSMLVCVKIFGNDLTINLSNQLGELELNMGMPLIAYELLQSIQILSNMSKNLATKCIERLRANVERCRYYAEVSPSLLTVLTPIIGYDTGAELAKKVIEKKKTVKQVLIEEGYYVDDLQDLIDPVKLAKGGIISKKSVDIE